MHLFSFTYTAPSQPPGDCLKSFATLISTLTLSSVLALAGTAFIAQSAHAASGTDVKKTTSSVSKSHRKAKTVRARRVSIADVAPEKASFGQIYGLHGEQDALSLKSSVALVMDQDTNEVLFSKNPSAVLPIASITKLMTALVVVEAQQSLSEELTITQDDIDTEKGSRSRLAVGSKLSREEMLHLALMASENRAANALGRNYPGGLSVFVEAMNRKAKALGMNDTQYVEPTGLSSRNQSSASDLAVLVKAAHEVPILREFSTSPEFKVAIGRRNLSFHTTNRLVSSPSWDIGLQKTGYISEAGRCLVMQAQMAGRKLILVFLDSAGKYSRIADAERVKKWVTLNASRVAE